MDFFFTQCQNYLLRFMTFTVKTHTPEIRLLRARLLQRTYYIITHVHHHAAILGRSRTKQILYTYYTGESRDSRPSYFVDKIFKWSPVSVCIYIYICISYISVLLYCNKYCTYMNTCNPIHSSIICIYTCYVQ